MALMTQLAKLRDSFDKHWYTLIASMSLSKWKSPSKWSLLIPRELRGSAETVFSSLLTTVSVKRRLQTRGKMQTEVIT